MSFSLTILGSNSATPAFNRHQTAQLLMIQHQYYLIDCGEGTQMQLQRYKIRFNKINHIFISHLHGDHYLGLVGLISTMHLQKRDTDLHIYGPPGLSEIISLQLKYSQTILNFKVILHELDTSKKVLIIENEFITVETIPLDHRINCAGFIFKERPKKRRINKERVKGGYSLLEIAKLKNGEDLVNENGEIIAKNDDLTLPPKRSRSYAYCSDTRFDEGIIEQIRNVDMLYHESTFLSDMEERATETYHSTARQAATIARKANAKLLVLGHYSTRYRSLEPILAEAKEVFENAILAIEGETIELEE